MPPFGLDYPHGPAKRKAETVVQGLRDIEGLQTTGSELQKDGWMLEWHMPDKDPHYPSALVLDRETGRLVELTIRMGPLGDHSHVDRETERELEGEWWTVVENAASDAGIGDQLTARKVDLGDKWIAEEIRPHVRFRQAAGGERAFYDISPRELVDFVTALDERFEDRFGDFHDRRYDPEFRDNFRGA